MTCVLCLFLVWQYFRWALGGAECDGYNPQLCKSEWLECFFLNLYCCFSVGLWPSGLEWYTAIIHALKWLLRWASLPMEGLCPQFCIHEGICMIPSQRKVSSTQTSLISSWPCCSGSSEGCWEEVALEEPESLKSFQEKINSWFFMFIEYLRGHVCRC